MSESPEDLDSQNKDGKFQDPADKYVGRAGCLSTLWTVLKYGVIGLCTVWAYGAIYHDGPAEIGYGNTAIAILWSCVALTFLLFLRHAATRNLAWLACFLVVLVPWLMKKPSNDRNWQPEWAQTGWVEFHDDEDTVTIHNYRDFDYNLDGTAVQRWEDKTVRLSNLEGLDYFHDAFGGDVIAHPILSFDFGEDGRVAISVETRREAGESFSELGGIYKMFELQYFFGAERDFVRVRTNLRKEPVYLYATRTDRQRCIEVFTTIATACNALKENPRFYHLVRGNCTTSLWAQAPAEKKSKFDYRLLANGKLDELLYSRGVLKTKDLPFSELRERAYINPAAVAAHDEEDFSARIRENRPGFEVAPKLDPDPDPAPDPAPAPAPDPDPALDPDPDPAPAPSEEEDEAPKIRLPDA